VVAKMLAKEPERRFQTPREVAEALKPFFKKRRVFSGGPSPDVSIVGNEGANREPVETWPSPSVSKDDVAPIPVSRFQSRSSERPQADMTSRQWQDEPELEGPGLEAVSGRAAARPFLSSVLVPTIGVSFLGIAITCAIWVLTIRTKDGTIVLENVPENALVEIDGNRITVSAHRKLPLKIQVQPGKHSVLVTRGDERLLGESVTLESGKQRVFTVGLEPVIPAETSKVTPETTSTKAKVILADRGQDTARKRTGDAKSLGASSINRSGMPAPSVLRGKWQIEGDEVVQDSLLRGATVLFGDPSWTSYDLRFQAKATEGTVGFVAVFHALAKGRLRRFELGAYLNKCHQLCQLVDGVWGRNDGMFCPGTIEFNRWYEVRVQVRGSTCDCYLDDALLFRNDDPRFTSGRIGFLTLGSKARFRKIKVTATDGTVLWEGVPELDLLGQAELSEQPDESSEELAAGSMEAESSTPPKPKPLKETPAPSNKALASRSRAPAPKRSVSIHPRVAAQAISLLMEAGSALQKLAFRSHPLRAQIRDRGITIVQEAIKEIEGGRAPVQRIEDLRAELEDLREAAKIARNQELLSAIDLLLKRAIEVLKNGVPAASTGDPRTSSP
jgi:hypothetical protein